MTKPTPSSRPRSDYELDNPPLFAVIAEIRFKEKLAEGMDASKLRSQFANIGLSIHSKKSRKSSRQGGVSRSSAFETFSTFTSLNRTMIVAISQDSLVVYCGEYRGFSEFSASLDKYVDIAATVSSTEGKIKYLSLRYLSGFECRDWPSPFLSPGLQGIDAATLEASHFHHEYRYSAFSPQGKLTLTTCLVHGDQLVPPEIQEIGLAVSPRYSFGHENRAVGMEVVSNSRMNNQPLHPQHLKQGLSQLRNWAKELFFAATTARAHEHWKLRYPSA